MQAGHRFADAIELTQFAVTYLPIPLEHCEIDHVHEFGSFRSEFIVIEWRRRRERRASGSDSRRKAPQGCRRKSKFRLRMCDYAHLDPVRGAKI